MSTPISADWLRTAERDGTLQAMAAGAQRFLEALDEPTARFEQAKKGGRYVSEIVAALNEVVSTGEDTQRSGPQENAAVADFWLHELRKAGSKGLR